jgi:hypothetical protein
MASVLSILLFHKKSRRMHLKPSNNNSDAITVKKLRRAMISDSSSKIAYVAHYEHREHQKSTVVQYECVSKNIRIIFSSNRRVGSFIFSDIRQTIIILSRSHHISSPLWYDFVTHIGIDTDSKRTTLDLLQPSNYKTKVTTCIKIRKTETTIGRHEVHFDLFSSTCCSDIARERMPGRVFSNTTAQQ